MKTPPRPARAATASRARRWPRLATATAASLLLLSLAQTSAAAGTATAPAGSAAAHHAAGDERAHHAGSGLAGRAAGQADPAAVRAATAGLPKGLDVSGYQENVNWASVAANGASFAYVKATEGTTYTSGQFSQQYNGSAAAGLIRGAYHFARPDTSGAVAQADFFVDHGGAWTDDGRTLPGALDIEYAPSGNTCYGLGKSTMVSWIAAFRDEYHSRTGVYPAIYSTTDWWITCTGNYAGFGGTSPLWIANYGSAPTPLPNGWAGYTVWQTDDGGTFPGDQDVFNGSLDDLKAFAHADYTPPPAQAGNWPTVSEGQSGRLVTTVQYLLNAHGAALTVNGQFDAATRAAVVSFQTDAGLTADGIVGPSTWQSLISYVKEGDSGPATKAVQAELNEHGAALEVDGEFGAATRAAVVSFQSGAGLTADGIVGPNTWQALLA
ncbi:GH25 family lysozyme [Streptomyces odontomachi]|uniref:GH25 family lysozyme n=1 Tax=Streptomyces odontomachi TaxID=2944940 RepID=UPI0021089648|nr:GH25 family lysozyme [Streptomyces sp. ODS25]